MLRNIYDFIKIDKTKLLISFLLWILFPIVILSLYIGIPIACENTYPSPKPIRVSAATFSEDRVMSNLQYLVEEIGVRVRKSIGNIECTEWLQLKINEILEKSKINSFPHGKSAELFVQGFHLFDEDMELFNVAVKVSSGTVKSEKSLLMSAHFDSVLYGPGGSDDGVNAMILLELLQNVLNSNEELKQPIVFVWVNDEENGFNGAAAFVEYFLFENITRFVNLESTGTGRSMLYRLKPYNVQKEIDSIYGIRISSLGIALSDAFAGTDYDIYTEAGVPGYDTAFYERGFYYHSQYDDLDNIRKGSVQYLGEGMRKIIRTYCFEDDSRLNYELNESDEQKRVFYDYLNGFQVSLTEFGQIFVAIVLFLWSLIFPFWGYCINFGVKSFESVKSLKENSKEKKEERRSIVYVIGGYFCLTQSQVVLNLLYFSSYFLSAVLGLVLAASFGMLASIKSIFLVNTQINLSIATFMLASIVGILFSQWGVSWFVWFLYSKERMRVSFDSIRIHNLNLFYSVLVLVLAFLPIKERFFLFTSMFINMFLSCVYVLETVIVFMLKCEKLSIPKSYDWNFRGSFFFSTLYMLENYYKKNWKGEEAEKESKTKKEDKKELLENISQINDDIEESKEKESEMKEEDKTELLENQSQIADESEESNGEKSNSDENEGGEKDADEKNPKEFTASKSKTILLIIRVIHFIIYLNISQKIYLFLIPLVILIPILGDVDLTLSISNMMLPLFLRVDYLIFYPGLYVALIGGLLGIITLFPLIPFLHDRPQNFCKMIAILLPISMILILIVSLGRPYSKSAPKLVQPYGTSNSQVLYNLTSGKVINESGIYDIDLYCVDMYYMDKNDRFFRSDKVQSVSCSVDFCTFKLEYDHPKTNVKFNFIEGKTYGFEIRLERSSAYSKFIVDGVKGIDYNIAFENEVLENNEIGQLFYSNQYKMGNLSSIISSWRGNITFIGTEYCGISVESHHCNYFKDMIEVKRLFDENREYSCFVWGGDCIDDPYYKSIVEIDFKL